MIHNILPVQFMCLTVFLHNLSPSPVWTHNLEPPLYTSYISSPDHCLLFTTHAIISQIVTMCFAAVSIISSIPSFSQLFTWNSIFFWYQLIWVVLDKVLGHKMVVVVVVSLHSLSLLIRLSSVSAITTKSSAYDSHGMAMMNSQHMASTTITNNNGLSGIYQLLPQNIHCYS